MSWSAIARRKHRFAIHQYRIGPHYIAGTGRIIDVTQTWGNEYAEYSEFPIDSSLCLIIPDLQLVSNPREQSGVSMHSNLYQRPQGT